MQNTTFRGGNIVKKRNDLLGIYIPTYNRKKELEVCLASFIPQLKPYGFPIFIADNNSTDGTKELIKKLNKRTLTLSIRTLGRILGCLWHM